MMSGRRLALVSLLLAAAVPFAACAEDTHVEDRSRYEAPRATGPMVIDGIGDEAGFSVVHDLTQPGPLATTVADYEVLAELLEPIRKAGTAVHLTLGNHDHRERFRRAIPSLAIVTRPAREFIRLTAP